MTPAASTPKTKTHKSTRLALFATMLGAVAAVGTGYLVVSLTLKSFFGSSDAASPNDGSLYGTIANGIFNALAFSSVAVYLTRNKNGLSNKRWAVSKDSCLATKLFASFGKNWLNAGVLINFFRDVLWAFLSSGVDFDPYNPFLKSLARNSVIAGSTAVFSACVAAYKVYKNNEAVSLLSKSDIYWEVTKIASGAIFGLYAWNIAPWVVANVGSGFAGSIGIASNLATSYRISVWMGLAEGPTQTFCNEFAEWHAATFPKMNFFLKTLLSPVAGTLWQISYALQRMGSDTMSDFKRTLAASFNLGGSVATGNAFQGLWCEWVNYTRPGVTATDGDGAGAPKDPSGSTKSAHAFCNELLFDAGKMGRPIITSSNTDLSLPE